MSTRLWFYLDTALALAEHAAAGSAFDLTGPEAVDRPALMMVAGDLACMVCAAVNTYEHLPHPGAQPGHRTRCTTCGTHGDTTDLDLSIGRWRVTGAAATVELSVDRPAKPSGGAAGRAVPANRVRRGGARV